MTKLLIKEIKSCHQCDHIHRGKDYFFCDFSGYRIDDVTKIHKDCPLEDSIPLDLDQGKNK